MPFAAIYIDIRNRPHKGGITVLKKLFPFSYKVKDFISMLFAAVIYLIIGVLASWLFISVLGIGVVGWIIDAYVAAGIILAILKWLGKV